jgi:hypothetical protein
MEDTVIPGQVLEDIARLLLTCFILTMGLLLAWFFFIVFAWDLTYRVHTSFLEMSRQQFDVVHYVGLTLTKAAAFIFFLCPYVAIRITLRRRPR